MVHFPFFSHTLIELSLEPVTMSFGSSSVFMHVTFPLCPSKVENLLPDFKDQMVTALVSITKRRLSFKDKSKHGDPILKILSLIPVLMFHSLAVPSLLLLYNFELFVLYIIENTQFSCPVPANSLSCIPFIVFHFLIVLSHEAVYKVVPSSANKILLT